MQVPVKRIQASWWSANLAGPEILLSPRPKIYSMASRRAMSCCLRA